MSSEFPRAGLDQSRVFALKLLAFVFTWAVMLFGSLQLLFIPMPAIHALCGKGG